MTSFKQIALLLAVILLGAAPGSPGDRPVHVATLNWAPYIGEDLPDNGFGAVILREVFHRAGYQATFHFMPWVRALKETEVGIYDAVGFAYRSAEREKKYLISDAFAESRLGFARIRGSRVAFDSLRDLGPYRIGVVRGFVNTPEFDALKSLNKEQVKTERMNIKKLINGRVDLILIDRFILGHLIEVHFSGRAADVEFLDPPLTVHPLHLMFSRRRESSPILVRAFNRAVEAMKQDGSIDHIMKQYGYLHAD